MNALIGRRGLRGLLIAVAGMLPAGCPQVGTPPSCEALRQSLVGTWIGVPPAEGLPVETITLGANHVYTSRYEGFPTSEVGLWDLGYAPENDFCDLLLVGDSDGVIHTTYNLLLDGDRLVLSIWGSGTTYYREGTTPPSSAD